MLTSQSHDDNRIGFYLLEARTNPNSVSLKEICFFYSWLTVSIFLKIGRLLQFKDSTSIFPIFFLLFRQQIRLIFNSKGFVRENTSALIEYPLLGDWGDYNHFRCSFQPKSLHIFLYFFDHVSASRLSHWHFCVAQMKWLIQKFI